MTVSSNIHKRKCENIFPKVKKGGGVFFSSCYTEEGGDKDLVFS